MGAHEATTILTATNEEKAMKAARAFIQECLDEDGNSAYNGTLSTCHGIDVDRTTRPNGKPLTLEQAEKRIFGFFERCSATDPQAVPKYIWKDGVGSVVGHERHVNGTAEKWGPAILIRVRIKGSGNARKWLLAGWAAA